MRDLSDILGDPTETLAAEAVFSLLCNPGDRPTWDDVVEELTHFPGVHCTTDAEQRIVAAWQAGEIVEALDEDMNAVFDLDPSMGKRLAARYAYGRLQKAAERGSTEVARILADESQADHFVKTFAAPVVDTLTADLEVSRIEALTMLYADEDQYSDSLAIGESFTLAKWLHLYLTEQNASG